MSEVKSKSNIGIEITLVIPEDEARMLIEMTGYGVNAFLKGYYKQLGKHYLEPHEKAVRSFFKSINQNLPAHIRKIDTAREVFSKTK